MFLITCGVLVAFIDHAGVYILKLCPWCSLDLQDKLKQLPVSHYLLVKFSITRLLASNSE